MNGMITHYNLSLFYACREWVRQQRRYVDVRDVPALIEQRKAEARIQRLVELIEENLKAERERIDPLSPQNQIINP